MKQLLRRIVPGGVKSALTKWAWKRVALTANLRSGFSVPVRRLGDWWIYNDIFVYGEYDEPINKALDIIPDGRPLTVVDLGANVGMFAIRLFDLMSARGIDFDRAKVYMVEGSPSLCRELQERMAAQPVPKASYQIINGLVGKRTGYALLNEGGEPAQNALGSSGTKVDYVDLTQYVNSSIDLLKCDIEGAEEEFLANYRELIEETRISVFELHHAQCNTSRCYELLSVFPRHHKIASHSTETVEMFSR